MSYPAAFISFGILSEEIVKFIREVAGEKELYTCRYQIGAMKLTDDIVSVTTTIGRGPLYIYDCLYDGDDDDTRTASQKKEDNKLANTPHVLHNNLWPFVADITPEQREALYTLVEKAHKDGNTVCSVFIASTDCFDVETYELREFPSGQKAALKAAQSVLTFETPKYVEIQDKTFIFAGFESEDAIRLQALTKKHGGKIAEKLDKATNYLVVNDAAKKIPTEYKKAVKLKWEKKQTVGIFSGAYFEEMVNSFQSIDGVLFVDNGKVLQRYPSHSKNETYIIPDGVTHIADDAFQGNRKVTSIILPNSVTSIGVSAFAGCSRLETITIPNSVTSIGEQAFSSCSKLKSIVIPDSVTSIGKQAFWGCTRLETITIPNSVTSIGEQAFSSCSKLKSIVIPDSVTSIGKQAFWGCTGLKNITIPDSVTSIGEWAFHDCTGLKSVTIPDSVTSIGEWAFRGCSGLETIIIPNSMTSIGVSAFAGCTGLKSITIPDSVTSIEKSAFRGCSNLESISLPESVTSIGEWAFEGCTGLKNIIIPDSVTSIGGWAFEGCSNLESISLPDSVTSIGDCAFKGCSGLSSITISASVTKIDWSVFSGCDRSLVIHTTEGSTAHEYAKKNGIKVELTD